MVGACNTVATHPGNADVLYAGFTNGGIWKTTNATNAAPTWTAQTDSLGSLSIGSIEFDPTDATSNTLLAGVGRTSSLSSIGGSHIGLLRTTNGGATWSIVGGATLTGKNISGVAARGATIVVSVTAADSFTYGNIGIFRSTDTGGSFTHISSGSPSTPTNGLYGGRAFDLAADPTNNAILYTVIRDAAANNGIYKSTDTGANWVRVSDAAVNAVLTDSSPSTSRVELAVGRGNNIFAVIVRSGRLSHVFRSGDGGGTWALMDLPGTTEGSNFYGIHVGGQGGTHLSVAADPSNPQVVYVGGDRQPAGDENVSPSFPNSLGASDYSGRLFRGNASLPAGSQWTALTHSGTASNSSPHADSRDMAFDANGRLIEGDDAGVYARTSPANATGNWFSLQGSLKSTEIHDIAYDGISNKIVVGTQDTGTAYQTSTSNWGTVSSGDGGDVAVDDVSLAGSNRSIRYTSYQNLGGLRRRTYNSSGVSVASAACTLTVLSGGPAISPQFYTPIEVNRVAPTRLLIAAGNGLYESLDQGATCTFLTAAASGAGDGLSGVGISYGGKSGATDNPDVIYAVDGTTVYVRTAPGTTFATTTVATGGNVLLDVVSKRDDYNTAYAVTSSQVFRTTNTGRIVHRYHRRPDRRGQHPVRRVHPDCQRWNHRRRNSDGRVCGESRGPHGVAASGHRHAHSGVCVRPPVRCGGRRARGRDPGPQRVEAGQRLEQCQRSGGHIQMGSLLSQIRQP